MFKIDVFCLKNYVRGANGDRLPNILFKQLFDIHCPCQVKKVLWLGINGDRLLNFLQRLVNFTFPFDIGKESCTFLPSKNQTDISN